MHPAVANNPSISEASVLFLAPSKSTLSQESLQDRSLSDTQQYRLRYCVEPPSAQASSSRNTTTGGPTGQSYPCFDLSSIHFIGHSTATTWPCLQSPYAQRKGERSTYGRPAVVPPLFPKGNFFWCVYKTNILQTIVDLLLFLFILPDVHLILP